MKYVYEDGRQWWKYDNRIDRGSYTFFWTPSIKILITTWIDDPTSNILTTWCDKNCEGRYFPPKVWWFMFEYDSDFTKFVKHFNLQLPIRYLNITDLETDVYYKIEVSAHDIKLGKNTWHILANWCYENCSDMWAIGPGVIKDGNGRISLKPLHVITYIFINKEDAMAFRLRWV